MSVFSCTSEDLHPYECDGPGKCRHCDRRIIVHTADEGTSSYEHHPAGRLIALAVETGGRPTTVYVLPGDESDQSDQRQAA